MTQFACRAVGLLLALLLVTAQFAGMAAPSLALQSGDGLPSPEDRDLANIPYLAPDPADSQAPAAGADTAMLPAGRLVHQSLRDGNWEIYVADADGANPMRVTRRDAADVQPRLNRGCTRIVFSNNASGNYEIATIGLDGLGLQRLTQHEAADTQPAWSQDGSWIVFQSTRDGQSEIYAIAADGSSLTRLTSHPAYDGYPAWSPDGARIAFSSNRSGSYAIWVMNTDGSNPVQLSNQPSSVYPVWSPDGLRLAYSADADGDDFLELWVMNADGSQQQLRHDPGAGSVDAWARSWSADGRWLAFTRLHLVLYEGTWYWDEAVLLATDMVYGSYPLELAMGGRDWHPDWQVLDALPPVTALDALSSYSRSWGTPLSWSAWDEGVGPAGVTCFDVQAQVDGGNWTDWLVHTPETSARYTGVAGQQVKFRIRGWDAVCNVSDWTPDDAAPSTQLYSFDLSGRVHDVRGFALPGAGVAIDPPPVTRTGVDAQATFQARLARAESTEVLVQSEGYASPPAPLGSIAHDLQAAFCLPPLDDGVSNGGFEAGGGSLAGWQTGGAFLPRTTTSDRHTGQAAAMLGPDLDPLLSPPAPAPGGLSSGPELAVSPDGTIHMLFDAVVTGEAYQEPHYTYLPPGGTWAAPIPVGNDGLYPYSHTAALALSGDGRLHAVWVSEAGIIYNHTLQDGTWAAPALIGPGGQGPALTVDSRGGLHVVYSRYVNQVHQLLETVQPLGGSWSPSELLLSGASIFRLAAGPGGLVHLLWSVKEDDTWNVFYRQWTPEGQWGPKEHVSECGLHGVRALVADADGRLHAMWAAPWPENDWADSRYAVRSLDGAWSTPQALAGMPYVDMATDSTGMVYAVYRGTYTGVDGTFLAFKHPGQEWSEPVFLDMDQDERAITIDSADNPHVVYSTWDGNVYRTALPAPQDASSTLSQAITIPSTQNHPTLSFFYRLEGVLPVHEGGLRVAVDDGVSSTVVLTTSAGAGWTHAWAPLDAWAGQTVTVTLAADSRAGEPYARLALDEVTVGSWMTPVPTEVSPGHVPAGVAAAITVTGQNLMPGAALWLGGAPLTDTTWAAEDALTATVPAGQAAGRQPLWVVNPGGARGPTIWLRVGETVFLPVILR